MGFDFWDFEKERNHTSEDFFMCCQHFELFSVYAKLGHCLILCENVVSNKVINHYRGVKKIGQVQGRVEESPRKNGEYIFAARMHPAPKFVYSKHETHPTNFTYS